MNVRNLYIPQKKKTLSQKPCTTINKICQNFVPTAPSPSVHCGRHKRMNSKSYILRSLQRNHKHNAKLNTNLEDNIFETKVSKDNCFIFKNKHLIATRSCVPVTIIRDEDDIEGKSIQQISEKQILHSLPKNEIKHLLNQLYIA